VLTREERARIRAEETEREWVRGELARVAWAQSSARQWALITRDCGAIGLLVWVSWVIGPSLVFLGLGILVLIWQGLAWLVRWVFGIDLSL
jgi:hypothetical protein